MSAESLCEKFADTDAWDEWLESGLPADVAAHVEDCDRCRDDLATFRMLQDGFDEIRERSLADVVEVDLTASLMSAVDDAERARRVSRSWALVGLVAALAVAFVALSVTRTESAVVQAENARWARGADSGQVHGRAELALPFVLESGSGVATILVERTAVRLEPNAKIELRDDALALLTGELDFESPTPFLVMNKAVLVEGQGEIRVEADREENEMKLGKKILGSAVLAVGVYAGWATVSSDEGKVRAEAPKELRVSASGKVTSHPLADRAKAEASATRVGASQLGLAGAPTTDETEAKGSGSFWSDEKSAIMFAVDGEIFDAVSGTPVTDFEIQAFAVKALDYGASNQRTFEFDDQKDGNFQLKPLVMGEWRVTARAKGYAPVTQTLDLSEVSKDPYLVIPMSGGAKVSGQVEDWRGRPVDGARVGLESCFDGPKAKLEKRRCAQVETGSDGRFVLEGVPAAEVFSVRAEHERYGMAIERNLERAEGETAHVVIRLSGILKLHGRVTKGNSGTPLTGVTVVGEDREVITDPDGRYEMFVPLKSRPRVHVETTSREGLKSKFASYPNRRSAQPLEWVEAETHVAEAEKNFQLSMEKARLFGRVTDGSGQPLADVPLTLHNSTGWRKDRGHETFPERTRTDEQGRYAIDGVPSQAGYEMHYEDEKGNRKRLGYVNVKDETEVEANFQLGEGSIRGRFVKVGTMEPFRVSPRSCGRLGARLIGEPARYHTARCYDDGRFEFQGLPAGEYEIHNRIEWMSTPVSIKATRATLGAGQVLSGVTVEVEGEESKTWKFRVVDAQGRFLPGGHLRYSQGGTSFTSGLQIGADGMTKATLNEMYKKVFFDVPGYASGEVDLTGRDPEQVIVVRLKRN